MRPDPYAVARRERTPVVAETQARLRYCWDVKDPIAQLERATAAYAEAVAEAERRRDARDAAIAAAFGEGVPIRVIASAVGLTAARVSDILGRPMGKPGRPRKEPWLGHAILAS